MLYANGDSTKREASVNCTLKYVVARSLLMPDGSQTINVMEVEEGCQIDPNEVGDGDYLRPLKSTWVFFRPLVMRGAGRR